MNRRHFFKTLASGLVVASTPVFFLPPRGGWIPSAHGGYLINTDHPLVGDAMNEFLLPKDIDWMLKQCWDAYRVEPTHIIWHRS